jgi:fatty-acyl-CoA synthase
LAQERVSEPGGPRGEIPTFAHALRALRGLGDAGFTFVQTDGDERFYSWHDLSVEASRRGRQLLAKGLRKGDHLGLVIPEGDEFVLSFLAALMVGVVPVPMYPPLAFGKLDAYIDATAGILRAADAKMLLTTKRVQAVLWSLVDKVPTLKTLLTVEGLAGAPPPDFAAEPDPDAIRPEDTAFLQFTSGSTAAPKGVVVAHSSLMANARAIIDTLDVTKGDKGVSWLPLYHDMGLIGFVLAPLRYTTPVVYIPTLDFVKHPTVWLDTVHKHRGTITFAPNFAFALVARRTPERKLAQLDLSCVKALGCGAEPNHPATLNAFLDRFAPAGLRRSAILPCYGMAEATLAMSFCALADELRTDVVDGEAYHGEGHAAPVLAAGAPEATETGSEDERPDERGAPAASGAGAADEASESGDGVALEFVSCGRPLAGHEIVVLDEEGRVQPERRVGEIVFRGPSVAAGYYKNPDATRATFADEGLRTGDLGYFAGGEIYVTGRRKDIVILNGRNYDPQTIEWQAAEVPGVRKGNVVAFSRPGAATEELVVVAETKEPPDAHAALAAAVKERIQEQLFLPVADVLFIGAGALPKTSSGKLQRAKTRLQYLDGSLGAEGVRTLGQRGQALTLAKHLARSLVSRVRHEVKTRATGLLGGGDRNE